MSTSSDTDVHVSLSEAIKVSDILSHNVVSSDSTFLFGSLKYSEEYIVFPNTGRSLILSCISFG
jgi:hypothetical protein